MRMYLIRHGHTELSESGQIAGFTDVNLSKEGRQAVSLLADDLPELAADNFYSSDLTRAVQTARILGGDANVIQDPRLRELNFGEWEGLTWDEVYQRDTNYMQRWSDNWLELAPPSGECFNELANRTNDWFREQSGRVKSSSDESSIFVVAHGGSIRALLCNVLGLPLHCAFSFSIDYARVTLLIISKDGHHQCRFVNGKSLTG